MSNYKVLSEELPAVRPWPDVLRVIEEAEAQEYARLLREELFTTDWHSVNAGIVARLSRTALKRIKSRAWDIAYEEER